MDINVTITNARKQFWDMRRYSYAKNPRPDFGVLLLIKGRMDYTFGNNLIELGPCDLIFLPQNSKYEVYIHTDEGPVENLLVNFIVREEDLQEIPITPFLKVNDSAGFFLPILEKIIEAYQHGGDQMLMAKSQLFFCIYQLVLAANKHKNANDVIEEAKKLLLSKNDYSVEEIAHKLLISSSGLRQQFKADTGLSPIKFRQRHRLEEAKNLLVSTDVSVKVIAERCNYYDAAYFCKVFEKETGMTPMEYRGSMASY